MLYRSSFFYEMTMKGLYGSHLPAKYQAVARQIPEPASVLDLCCGPGNLFDYLNLAQRKKYLGVDNSANFVSAAAKKSRAVRHLNIFSDSIPTDFDCICLLSSLYQFIPDADFILRKILGAARELVIVSEPILNLSSNRNFLVGSVLRRLTRPEENSPAYQGQRFDHMSLGGLMKNFESVIVFQEPIAGGREQMYVLNAKAWREIHEFR